MRKKPMARPPISGWDVRNFNEPKGLARFQSKGRRFSLGRDSGNMKKPYKKLRKQSPAAAQNGALIPQVASKPPRAGPRTNPNPKAAPIMPKFLALVVGSGLTSAM